MDTPDTVDKVPSKKGRPKKQDSATPLGEYIAEQAKATRDKKAMNKVVEKYYEVQGNKLSLIKKVQSGSVFKTFIGSLNDPKEGDKIQAYAKKLKAEGRLRTKI
jgi:hypothetical protein